MKIEELARLCVERINLAKQFGTKMKDVTILVVLPPGWKCPPRFPRGTLLQVKPDGSRVRYLKAMNVLAWLAANKLIKVETAEGEDFALLV